MVDIKYYFEADSILDKSYISLKHTILYPFFFRERSLQCEHKLNVGNLFHMLTHLSDNDIL